MNNELFIEAQKHWAEIGHFKQLDDMRVELEFYKKMLSIFQIGSFYYFIFCPSISRVESISDSITEVLGYAPEYFTTENFLESIHPEDVNYFVDFEKKVVTFKKNLSPDKLTKYKSQYNYRIRKADGAYIPILQQSITIQYDEDGAILRNLVIHTDITTLNPVPGKGSLSFIGMEGEPSFYNVQNEHNMMPEKQFLTRREKEILHLLSQNKTTEEIAASLFISPATVSTHRKNIHAKTGTHNVLELIMKSVEKGWLFLMLFFSLSESLIEQCVLMTPEF